MRSARVAELADALDLGSSTARCKGSTPFSRTIAPGAFGGVSVKSEVESSNRTPTTPPTAAVDPSRELPVVAQAAVTFGLPLLATGGRLLLDPLLGNAAPFILFFPALVISALYCGARSGLIATALSAASAWLFILDTSAVGDAVIRLAALVIVGSAISWIAGRVHYESRRSRVAERELRGALERVRQSAVAAELHSRVLGAMSEGVMLFDEAGRITFANAALDTMFRVAPGQLVGRNALELTGGAESAHRCRISTIAEVVASEGFWIAETTQPRADGERFLTRMRVSCVTGSLRQFVCVLEDISALRRRDEALGDANRRLQQRVEELATLLNVLPIGIGIADDVECRNIQINPAFAKLLRLDENANASLTAPDRERPRNFHVLLNGETLSNDQLPMQVAAREGVASHDVELDVVFDDGQTIRLLEYAVPLFDDQGRPRGSIGAFVDISERRQVEQEREKLVERLTQRTQKLVRLSQGVREVNDDLNQTAILRALVRAALQIADAPWGMAGLKHDGKLAFHEYCSGDQFMPLDLVYQADDPQGVSAWVMRHHTHYLSNDAADDDVIRPELRRRFGVTTLVNLPILGRRDEILGCLELHNKPQGFTAEDCVKLQTLVAGAAIALQNAQLLQHIREADRRKDEFLAMLAHELRNPLAPLRSALDYFAAVGDGDDTARELREIMSRQVEHMGRIIDDLLDVSRINRGRIELRRNQADLATIVHGVVAGRRAVCADRRLTLVESLPVEPVWAQVDETRIAQVLDNLLTNAAKFSEDGGRITVALVENRAAAVAELSVTDTGIGISPDDLSRIFDIFTQADRSLDRSRGGLGLGLALVKGLTELHGGHVVAHSDGIGRGSTFTVILPLAAEPQPQVVEYSAPPIVERSTRVLVVEDNRDAATTLRLILERHGHVVEVAHDGSDGLEAAREFRPEVVVCDIGLPGLDGYAVAAALRADHRFSAKRLIALSGYGRDEDRTRAMHAGFDEHLTKPVDAATLLRLIAESALAVER